MGRLFITKNEMYAGLDTDTAGALPTGRDKRAVQSMDGKRPGRRRFSCLLRQLAEKLIKILLHDGQVL